jgi:hypothetical protein
MILPPTIVEPEIVKLLRAEEPLARPANGAPTANGLYSRSDTR